MINHRTCVRAIAASVLFGMPVAPAWAQSGTTATQTVDAHPSVPKAFASATTPTSYARETYKLPQRLAKQPIAFDAMAQLADPGNQTKDPTQPWPADRRMVDLGTITIMKAVPDSAAAEKALLFLPNRLPSGIEASDDPLIGARVQAYLIPVGRRTR